MSAATRYRGAIYHSVKGRQGNRLIVHPSGERVLLPEAVAALLDRLVAFLTLDEHEKAAAQQFGVAQGRDPGIRKTLEDLRRRGLLISEQEFFQGVMPGAVAEGRPITRIGIPARAGSATLERCISSYAAHAAKFGHSVQFIVAGSDAPVSSSASVRYIGDRGKEQIARSLEGCDPAAVRFALFGVGPGLPPGLARNTGANRNALLLAYAGEPFLSVDDDTICSLSLSPNARDTFAVQSVGGPKEIWFAPDLPSLPEAADLDLLAEIGRALGPAVRRVAPISETPFGSTILRNLMTGQARATLAQAGLFGDAANQTPAGWLATGGPTRKRLLESESGYKQAMASRRIRAVASCETISDTSELMSYCLGIDAGTDLPPFPPLGRDQDGIFGIWHRSASPLSVTTHLPFAVAHEPEEVRAYPRDSISRPVQGMALNEMLRLVFESFSGAAPSGGTSASRLDWFGKRLLEVGAQPAGEFAQFLLRRRLESLGQMIVLLEALLAAHGSRPAWWARDVQTLIRGYEQAMTEPDVFTYCEPGVAASPDNILEVFRSYVNCCGNLLQEWPSIWDCATSKRNG